jgi:hypothetical protein
MLRRFLEVRRAGSNEGGSNQNLSQSQISESDVSASGSAFGGVAASAQSSRQRTESNGSNMSSGTQTNHNHPELKPTAAASATTASALASSVIRSISASSTARMRNWSTSRTENFNADERLRELVTNTMKVEGLKVFDACIETSDSLASISTSSGRVDDATGLVDCSVLVSADGELLLIPQEQQTKEAKRLTLEAALAASPTTKRKLYQEEEERFLDGATAFWRQDERQANELGDEYQSAVFMGNDLHNHGDRALNGFSAKGWSTAASSLAMKQSADAMRDLAGFVEELVLTKKSCAAQENQMLNKLREMVEESKTGIKIVKYQRYLQETFPDDHTVFEVSSTRVGPLLSQGGTVHATMVGLENFYSTIAESDSNLWRKLTLQSGGLTKLQHANQQTDERVLGRQVAVQDTMRRVQAMEEHLVLCKEDAKQKWNLVHEAEMRVNQLVEDKMMERSRLREQQRMERIKQDEAKRAMEVNGGALGATSSEIWDIVSEVTASMDEGSFEPMDIPDAYATISRDKSWTDSDKGEESFDLNNSDSMDEDGSNGQLQIPMTSRHELEEECGLPDLRSAALAADEAVENAANSLLSVLSNWDSTSRSARLAAETCLISASNAQVSCLKSIIALERESITERLKLLEEVEAVAAKIDVRGDMNRYITMDKQEPGGQSFLGEDNDGGVASALAVLNNHAYGDPGIANPTNYRESKSDDNVQELSADDESIITPEFLEDAVERFFRLDPILNANAANDSTKAREAIDDFEVIIERLCSIGRDKSPKARSRRSMISYSMNAKRNSHATIQSVIQFEGLCRVFAAILAGCNMDSSGVASAKLLMNLSQIFHVREMNSDGTSTEIHIQSRLADHPLWEKDEFWDEALHQSVAESITHSGVVANIEGTSSRIVTATTKQRSEWTDSYSTKWHDLKEAERYQAASQVHAVVCAQVGAMSQSMMDFGCGLERTSAFVRRMSIRNRLPISQRTTLLRHLIGRDVE